MYTKNVYLISELIKKFEGKNPLTYLFGNKKFKSNSQHQIHNCNYLKKKNIAL